MLRRVVYKSLSSARFQSTFPKRTHELLESTGTAFSELSNGVRVASVSNSKPTSTIGIYLDSGSRYEVEGNNGVASLLERIIYKGSQKRSAKQLEEELGKHGAKLNSFTNRDHTAYLVQVANENVEPVVDILADVLRNPKITTGEVEAEKQALIKKLNEIEQNHEEVVWDMLHASAFQGTGFALSPFGKTKDINALTVEDVVNFADDHYKSSRVVIAAVGGIGHESIKSFASKNFGDLNEIYQRKVPPGQGVRFTGSEYHYRNDYYPYVYGAMAMEGVNLAHMDALALKLSSQLVGSWNVAHGSSSNSPVRAVQILSALPALISYNSFSVNYTDTGLFGFNFVAKGDDLANVQEIINKVQRQWKWLATSVTDDDVDRAKNQLRTNLLGQLQSNATLAHWLAVETLGKGKPSDVADLELQIRKLDASSVREAISRHVYDRDFAIVGCGQTEALPNYVVVRVAQSWWRL